MADTTITYLVLAGVVVFFVLDLVPVEITALGAALVLYATDVIDLDQTIGGFGDPAVVLIAALFVVSAGLDATGVTSWVGQAVIARAGGDQRRLVILVLLLVAGLTALISVNGAVASLLPMVVIVSLRAGIAPSRLLMPLAFGAHAGSMLALTGTPVNVLVSDAALDAGAGRFEFFEFTVVGVPLVVGTILVVTFLGPRLLVDRVPGSLSADLSAHAATLSAQYLEERRVFRLIVDADSRCADSDPDEIELGRHPSLALVGVQVDGRGRPGHPDSVSPGDVLIVLGEATEASAFAHELRLTFDEHPFTLRANGELMDRELGLTEVVIPPRSEMVGRAVFPGMVTDSGDLVILAVQRAGVDLGPVTTTLDVGDVLLLQGRWPDLERNVGADAAVVALDDPDQIRRQAIPRGRGSTRAMAILAAMVVLLATGVVPAVVAGVVAAMAMVVSGALSMQEAYRGIAWTTVVLVAAMFPVSTAMTESGAAEQIASGLVDIVGSAGPRMLLLGIFVLVAVLGQLISNMATALIVIPIAVSAAAELDISVQPVLMCVTVAAAAALLTPVATPANLMVMEPAGYRFTDYARLGLPLLVLYGVVAVGVVPLVWSF